MGCHLCPADGCSWVRTVKGLGGRLLRRLRRPALLREDRAGEVEGRRRKLRRLVLVQLAVPICVYGGKQLLQAGLLLCRRVGVQPRRARQQEEEERQRHSWNMQRETMELQIAREFECPGQQGAKTKLRHHGPLDHREHITTGRL